MIRGWISLPHKGFTLFKGSQKFSIHCCEHCQCRIVIFGCYVWLRIPKYHKDTLLYALVDDELKNDPRLKEELDLEAQQNHSNIYSNIAYSMFKSRINNKTPKESNERL